MSSFSETLECINFWCWKGFNLSKDEGLNFIFLLALSGIIRKAWVVLDPDLVQSFSFIDLMRKSYFTKGISVQPCGEGFQSVRPYLIVCRITFPFLFRVCVCVFWILWKIPTNLCCSLGFLIPLTVFLSALLCLLGYVGAEKASYP